VNLSPKCSHVNECTTGGLLRASVFARRGPLAAAIATVQDDGH